MKRIINGRTYNTDTATKVARWEFKDEEDYDTVATLYQNRGGAFFTVYEWTVTHTDDWGARAESKVSFEAVSPSTLEHILRHTDDIEILNEDILEPPPEAEADERATSTVYLRLPPSLKDRAEDLAKGAGLSLNSWAIRCLERCAHPSAQ